MRKIKIGLLGYGTVGSATYQAIQMNHEQMAKKIGIDLEISKILVREMPEERLAPLELFTKNADEVLNDESLDIIIELIGGIEPATSFMIAAMNAGKAVVTANKAAVAANYESLLAAAAKNKVMLRFEASVAGGIPILDALQAPLNSNNIEEVRGIVNGTTNFILSQMTEKGLTYPEVLKVAQEKGFAEADPTADVEGIDAANKLSILIALAFDARVKVEEIPTTGVTGVAATDIALAQQLGYEIKLLASTKKTDNIISASVQPTLVPKNQMLASVANEYNALLVRGNAVDDLLFYGKGAGGLPTASAVLGDVIEIANAIDKGTAFDSYVNQAPDSDALHYIGEGSNAYYVRLTLKDLKGRLHQVLEVFEKFGLSVDFVQQDKDWENEKLRKLSLIFHETERAKLDEALSELKAGDKIEQETAVFAVINKED